MAEHDPTDLRVLDERKAQADDLAKRDRQQEVDDFLFVMSKPQGLRFVWRLLGMTGVFRNPFTGNSETFFRCGEMNIGQKLLGQIHELCPDKYAQMVNAMRKAKHE